MDVFMSVAGVTQKIRELEDQQKMVAQKLEKVELQKREGARFYQGTELKIEDVIFSLKEGQQRSVQIALDFYRRTLQDLDPGKAALAEQPAVKVQVNDSVA